MMNTELMQQARQACKQALARLTAHPFVRQAHRRELSKDQVLRWIMAAGCDSRAFRDLLEKLVNRLAGLSDYGLVYQILKENLDDENGNDDPNQAHWRHYIHLAQQLGITEEQLLDYTGKGGVRYAIDLARSVPLWSTAKAVGYMLVNEGATPVAYGAVEIAAHHHFPQLATSFFTMHVEVDEHHVTDLYRAVSLLPGDDHQEVLDGIALGSAAWPQSWMRPMVYLTGYRTRLSIPESG